MKKYFHLTIVLFLIASLSGLLLGVVYDYTKEDIKAADDAKVVKGVNTIFDRNDLSMDNITILPISSSEKTIKFLYEVKDGDNLLGYVFQINAPKSYSGTLVMLVGIKEDGSVIGTSYVFTSETPGLGKKVETDTDFNKQFQGKVDIVKDGRNYFLVTKNGEELVNTPVDTISGATISSKSVIMGVDYCIEYFKENLKK